MHGWGSPGGPGDHGRGQKRGRYESARALAPEPRPLSPAHPPLPCSTDALSQPRAVPCAAVGADTTSGDTICFLKLPRGALARPKSRHGLACSLARSLARSLACSLARSCSPSPPPAAPRPSTHAHTEARTPYVQARPTR